MLRRSLSSARAPLRRALSPQVGGRAWLSTALTPEEQEMLSEEREGMDYDVLLVRKAALA